MCPNQISVTLFYLQFKNKQTLVQLYLGKEDLQNRSFWNNFFPLSAWEIKMVQKANFYDFQKSFFGQKKVKEAIPAADDDDDNNKYWGALSLTEIDAR